ncbi:hypothetical protein VaNZ11_009061 [Volvox africanus]|uniref:Prolamin-like domain-containing protein n=1 Tax=Volvox africanus TaxID=51714 RepID=A0ABQ5S8J5_9CHLO|nr:hypothetical protein VaNZ11_009061 [Volvox africanus]
MANHSILTHFAPDFRRVLPHPYRSLSARGCPAPSHVRCHAIHNVNPAWTLAAVDTAMCDQAGRDLPNNPDIKAFKDCAYSTLTPRCCRKLLPFAKYYDCLEVPTYRDQVNNFLKDTKKTIDNIMDECGG